MASKSNKREKGIKGNKREFPYWKQKGKGNNTFRYSLFPLSRIYRFTACQPAGYLSFLFDQAGAPGSQDHRKNAVKLARFLHVLGVKNGYKSTENSLIMVIDNYAKSIYHNHDIQIPQKTRKKHNFQMINDLQRRFENADNFSVV